MRTDPTNHPAMLDGWRAFLAQVICALGATALILLMTWLLNGCSAQSVQAPESRTEVIEKQVMVTQPCIKQEPVAPRYRWGVGELPATDREKVGILLADRALAVQYGIDWEAAATGCVEP